MRDRKFRVELLLQLGPFRLLGVLELTLSEVRSRLVLSLAHPLVDESPGRKNKRVLAPYRQPAAIDECIDLAAVYLEMIGDFRRTEQNIISHLLTLEMRNRRKDTHD